VSKVSTCRSTLVTVPGRLAVVASPVVISLLRVEMS
jgi:hypothetical protein